MTIVEQFQKAGLHGYMSGGSWAGKKKKMYVGMPASVAKAFNQGGRF